MPGLPMEASKIAAITWLVNTIENFAIERYAGKRENYEKIKGILTTAAMGIKELGIDGGACEYEQCTDQKCMPVCSLFDAVQAGK